MADQSSPGIAPAAPHTAWAGSRTRARLQFASPKAEGDAVPATPSHRRPLRGALANTPIGSVRKEERRYYFLAEQLQRLRTRLAAAESENDSLKKQISCEDGDGDSQKEAATAFTPLVFQLQLKTAQDLAEQRKDEADRYRRRCQHLQRRVKQLEAEAKAAAAASTPGATTPVGSPMPAAATASPATPSLSPAGSTSSALSASPEACSSSTMQGLLQALAAARAREEQQRAEEEAAAAKKAAEEEAAAAAAERDAQDKAAAAAAAAASAAAAGSPASPRATMGERTYPESPELGLVGSPGSEAGGMAEDDLFHSPSRQIRPSHGGCLAAVPAGHEGRAASGGQHDTYELRPSMAAALATMCSDKEGDEEAGASGNGREPALEAPPRFDAGDFLADQTQPTEYQRASDLCASGNVRALKALLRRADGFDPERLVAPAVGGTLLMCAAAHGQLGAVRLLLGTVGCNAIVVDRYGRTAVDIAAAGGHPKLAAYLDGKIRQGIIEQRSRLTGERRQGLQTGSPNLPNASGKSRRGRRRSLLASPNSNVRFTLPEGVE